MTTRSLEGDEGAILRGAPAPFTPRYPDAATIRPATAPLTCGPGPTTPPQTQRECRPRAAPQAQRHDRSAHSFDPGSPGKSCTASGGRSWPGALDPACPPDHPPHGGTMSYTLPDLPYAYDALEPNIDAKTMEIHHSKHHQTYVNSLNAAVEGTPWAELPVEELVSRIAELPDKLKGPVTNHGGGHANHSLFWTVMSPRAAASPAASWPRRSTPSWAASRRSRRPSPRRRSPASAAAGPGCAWTRPASSAWRTAPTRTAR